MITEAEAIEMNDFKQWLETATSSSIKIADANGYSGGRYGDETHPDVPAGDPTSYLTWNFYIKPNGWNYLEGYPVILRFRRSGSYHEQFFNLKAIINLPNEVFYEMEDEELIDFQGSGTKEEYWERERKIEEKTFIFVNFNDFFQKCNEEAKTSDFKYSVKSGDTLDAYWKKVMEPYAHAGTPDKYKPTDDYFKKPYK